MLGGPPQRSTRKTREGLVVLSRQILLLIILLTPSLHSSACPPIRYQSASLRLNWPHQPKREDGRRMQQRTGGERRGLERGNGSMLGSPPQRSTRKPREGLVVLSRQILLLIILLSLTALQGQHLGGQVDPSGCLAQGCPDLSQQPYCTRLSYRDPPTPEPAVGISAC